MESEFFNQSEVKTITKYRNNFTLKQNLILFFPTFLLSLLTEKICKKINSFVPFFPMNFKDRVSNIKKIDKYFKNRVWLKCSESELIWIYPHLSDDESKDIYAESFWSKAMISENSLMEEAQKENERTICQFKFISSYLPTFSGTFADFGAGSCQSTKYAKTIYSIEKNIVIDNASQTKKICELLNYEFYNYEQFDELTNIDFFFASHSVEHVISLKNFMDSLSKILSENAYVFIEVPCLHNESDLKVNFHAPHTYYLNKKSMLDIFHQYHLELLSPESMVHIEGASVIRALFKKI